MFKNEINITQSYVLSKKEKKDIAKILTKYYDTNHIDYIFKNFQNLSFHKISGNKKRILFYDNNPIFFEYNPDIFYPTVYILNMLPNLMGDRKCSIYDETDEYLANGADLMLKGIINREEIKKNVKFKLNDIFCVETLSGAITMLGETLISWNLMNTNNPSGKFLKSLHRIEDALWNLGNKKLPKKLIVPELEKLSKSKIQADKEIIEKLNSEKDEAKKLLNKEFIELVKKMNLDLDINFDKINTIFDSEEDKSKLEKILEKANLIPIFDVLLKEKLSKEEIQKNIEEENEEVEESDSHISNENDNQVEDYDENQEIEEEEENIENYQKYLNVENLEFITQKITSFNSYYECLENEINKFLESKYNQEKKEHNNNITVNQDKEDRLSNEIENKDTNNNKKIKQHKNHKNKKEKDINKYDLIDISSITNSETIGTADKNEINEIEKNNSKNEFLKLNSIEFDYVDIKSLKDQLSKLNEFTMITLILLKSKSDPNFLLDPKILILLSSYSKNNEDPDRNKDLDNQNTQEINDKEYEENEILNKITQEEMDANINLVFLSILKIVVFPQKDELFPLDPGKLLKDYLKPMANELGILIDFKYSSFKKINNYLKTLAKNDELIVFSKPKGMQNDFILSVNWQSDKLKNFVPPIKKAKFVSSKPVDKSDERENVILNKDEKIELMQMFKPNGTISDIFKRYDKEYESSSLYPISKCNEILTNYLKAFNLFSKGSGEVTINQELKEKLFKKSEKKVGEKVKMEELFLLWRKNLNEKDIVTKTSGESTEIFKTTKRNTTCKIKIMAKKLNNKNVTIVDGLNFFVDLKDITKTFSKHFACSVTIKPYQNSENMVFIQGYWVHELIDILQNELKLGKNFIVVEDKLNLKKK